MSRSAARSLVLGIQSSYMAIFVASWSAGTELRFKHVCKPFSRSESMHARIRITLREYAPCS
jgi:hypothetical protein